MSRTIVLKNDVNRRAGNIHHEGYVLAEDLVHCTKCQEPIEDDETCYYAVKNRGYDSHSAGYFHIRCEPDNAVKPFTDRRTSCVFCSTSENLDRITYTKHRSRICYHFTCLSQAKDESIPEKKLKTLLAKRNKGRISRGKIHYEVIIDPYNGLDLIYNEKNPRYAIHGGQEKIARVILRTLDGKLSEVRVGREVYLYQSGKFVSRATVEHRIDKTIEDAQRERYYWGVRLEEKDKAGILQLYDDLSETFTNRGYPKSGERLDSDYRLRFLLATGNSIEGFINAKKPEETGE